MFSEGNFVIRGKVANFVANHPTSLMEAPNLTGMGVALVTPFDHNKAIDFKALASLVDYQISRGADYLVVLGTTSEAPTLEADERAAVMRFVADRVAGRVPLVLGLGGNCTSTIVRELETLEAPGYSAILSVVPFYNKPSQEGIYRHYRALDEASHLPIILYNVPGRTGVNMTAETTLRVARDCRRVVAIKEASGRIDQARDIIEGAPEGFSLISGDDSLTYELISIGAVGVISVIGNALPEEYAEMVHTALKGDMLRAKALDDRLRAYYPLLSVDGNPAGIKSLLSLMGKIDNELRLPLVPASEDTRSRLARVWSER